MKPTYLIGVAAFAAAINVSFAQNPETRRGPVSSTAESRVLSNTGTGMALIETSTPDGSKTFVSRLKSIIGRGNGAERTLVIPRDTADTNRIVNMEEDLNVMAHILAKAADSDGKPARAMGIAVYSNPFGQSTAPQNLYLEGYGAVFFLKVNFPLLAPPDRESGTSADETPSSEWEEARREISQSPQPFGAGGGGSGGYGGSFAGGGAFIPGNAPVAYDSERVETLKRELIAALKNVAHIRNLNPDEVVTVVVTGPGTMSDAKTKKRTVTNEADYGAAVERYEVLMGERPETRFANLILHVKKSDAEAFRSGNLSADDFRGRVGMILY
jgi:hypothetical protein